MAPRTKKEEFPDIVPCKFAGDTEDEICVDCNGVVMTVDGKKYSCKECQAYTEPDPEPEKPVEQPAQEEKEELPAPEEFQTQGVTTSIKAESGLSVELKDRNGATRWYKFTYAEERAVPAGCDIEKEKHALWNDVNRTVDQQLEDTMIYLESK